MEISSKYKSILFFFVYILRTFASVIFNIFDLRGNTRLLGYHLYIQLFIYLFIYLFYFVSDRGTRVHVDVFM